ncbi:MAG: hypothetical protein AAF845_17135 [Bacteroidota bacterium]
MRRLAFLLTLVALAGCDPEAGPLAALQPGVAEGREGVRLLGADSLASNTDAASAAFVAGLALDDVPRSVQARLWHGVGLARAEGGRYAEADSAFAEALVRADDPARRARYALDAGTAALLGGDAAGAVTRLRRSLVLDPTNATARRSYEIARRLLTDDPEAPEPSDLAERLKAQADSLVEARQYRAALDVMQGGLAQDSTVATYADFINRLGGIVQIEETVPAAPR